MSFTLFCFDVLCIQCLAFFHSAMSFTWWKQKQAVNCSHYFYLFTTQRMKQITKVHSISIFNPKWAKSWQKHRSQFEVDLHRWSLVLDKPVYPIFHNGCNYLSMLWLQIIQVSKRGPSCLYHWTNDGRSLLQWPLSIEVTNRLHRTYHKLCVRCFIAPRIINNAIILVNTSAIGWLVYQQDRRPLWTDHPREQRLTHWPIGDVAVIFVDTAFFKINLRIDILIASSEIVSGECQRKSVMIYLHWFG